MTSSALTELLSYTQEHAGPASSRIADFVAAYFDSTDPDELQARGPASLFASANAHWRLLDTPRSANTAKVRVFNPTLAEDGFVSDHTVVQIVNDNMPLLVDSVTMPSIAATARRTGLFTPCSAWCGTEKAKSRA